MLSSILGPLSKYDTISLRLDSGMFELRGYLKVPQSMDPKTSMYFTWMSVEPFSSALKDNSVLTVVILVYFQSLGLLVFVSCLFLALARSSAFAFR